VAVYDTRAVHASDGEGQDSMSSETTPAAIDLSDPLHAEPATQTVLTRLREMLVTGEIEAGTRLRAEALAAQLEVSRTPIRSALAVLSAEGLVSYSVNRGYTVRAVSLRDILDSIEARAALESLAARLSVEFGWEPAQLGALQAVAGAGRAIVDRGAWSVEREREWYDLNWRFHRMMNQASQNAVLRNAVRMTVIYPVFGDVIRVCPTVSRHVPPRARQLPDATPDHIRDSQADHEAIVASIKAGDAEEAGRLMSAHVLATKARVHALATVR
jgi:GntR family transcriptional regulator of vanillate catabolism